MIKLYKESPRFRFSLRTLAVAVISFLVAAMAHGAITDWTNFLYGLVGAILNAALGLLTPLEPFVGVGKAKRIVVPADQTIQGR